MLIDRLFPVRFGIVPIVETEDSVKMAKVFYYLVQNYGRRATMGFLGSVRTMCFCHSLLSFMSHQILDVSGANGHIFINEKYHVANGVCCHA